MISYSRDSKEAIPSSAVKIIGLGGAGANMLERIALDSIDGAELLALNTDIRTLGASMAKDKIQLGVNLTKGLGTGGDPELGHQAMLEAEANVRQAISGQKIVFLCTGLGGGTGSGAAPIVARIAREEGAFVVVFATMPFFFEGRRRRDQAETALNQLAVLSSALVTFDNNRMGELVLAKQGIHEAFAAADRMISESIKAVIRLVIRPGLINVGLDDLMSALRTNRSRCLFGSGVADGKDRASKALRNALSSPLLDQGSLLKEAQTVLVHLSGGESLTLFEIELLMQNLQKHVPDQAHVLFGAVIDPAMGDSLSITLISALPEDALTGGRRDSVENSNSITDSDTQTTASYEEVNPFTRVEPSPPVAPEAPTFAPAHTKDSDSFLSTEMPYEDFSEPASESDQTPTTAPKKLLGQAIAENFFTTESSKDDGSNMTFGDGYDTPSSPFTLKAQAKEERPFAEPELHLPENHEKPAPDQEEILPEGPSDEPSEEITEPTPSPIQESVPAPVYIPTESQSERKTDPVEDAQQKPDAHDKDETPAPSRTPEAAPQTKLKLDSPSGSQSELSFDNAPRGRFEGENPNVFEGEDLDLPPFLRKKKS